MIRQYVDGFCNKCEEDRRTHGHSTLESMNLPTRVRPNMTVALTDKVLLNRYSWLKDETKAIACSDEGEALAIAAGIYLATGERPWVYISADGFCNALNFLTSWVLPEKIKMGIAVSTGRQEPPHKVMSDSLEDILKSIGFTLKEGTKDWYDTETVSVGLVR